MLVKHLTCLVCRTPLTWGTQFWNESGNPLSGVWVWCVCAHASGSRVWVLNISNSVLSEDPAALKYLKTYLASVGRRSSSSLSFGRAAHRILRRGTFQEFSHVWAIRHSRTAEWPRKIQMFMLVPWRRMSECRVGMFQWEKLLMWNVRGCYFGQFSYDHNS